MHGPCLLWNGVRVQLGEGTSRQHSLLLDFGKVELFININLRIIFMINHIWYALIILEFSRLHWCDSGCWYCKLKTIDVFAVADVDVEECVDDSMTAAFNNSVTVSNCAKLAKLRGTLFVDAFKRSYFVYRIKVTTSPIAIHRMQLWQHLSHDSLEFVSFIHFVSFYRTNSNHLISFRLPGNATLTAATSRSSSQSWSMVGSGRLTRYIGTERVWKLCDRYEQCSLNTKW